MSETNQLTPHEEYIKVHKVPYILWLADRCLKTDNIHEKNIQVERLAGIIAMVAIPTARTQYAETIAKNYGINLKDFRDMINRSVPKSDKKKTIKPITNRWTVILIDDRNQAQNISDKLSEEQIKSIQQYHFLEWQKTYYFVNTLETETKSVTLIQRSNFALRILFHIKRNKNKNKRVVAIYNQRGQSEVIDIETKQLTSLQAFKEFTEGAGYFLFKGTNEDLTRIKTKLMEEEKPCVQLDTLGWHRKGFFAFSNGIIRENKFIPVDEFGIVEFNDHNYFIPYHPGTDETQNINEKKFSWKPSAVSWHEWSQLYYQVFGSAGMVAMMFGCATLFSDHIFYVKTNFPILFLYGEGGSGKSKIIQFLQNWFGEHQPSLKVSEKANTDKGKIRKMAQFSNSLALFEEFVNTVDMSLIKTFTGFYDRYGYERADIDSKYGTETVPVLSTVAFTGNEYPTDDPFLQRLILLDVNVNEFTALQQKLFDQLNKLNRQGLTHLVQYLLRSRKLFEESWEGEYEKYLDGFKKLCATDMRNVPSRMMENNAVLLATYSTLKLSGIEFPFSIDELGYFLHESLRAQVEKRDTGGVIQRFWDIIIHLLASKKIENGKHLELNGDEVMIRVVEIHAYYMQEHYNMYRQQGLNKSTLLQKLRDSPAFIELSRSHRFRDKNTSCYVFKATMLSVDLAHWVFGPVVPGANAVNPSGKQISLIDYTEARKDPF